MGKEADFSTLGVVLKLSAFFAFFQPLRTVRKRYLISREENNCWSFRKDERSIDEPFGQVYSSDPEIWVL